MDVPNQRNLNKTLRSLESLMAWALIWKELPKYSVPEAMQCPKMGQVLYVE